MRDNRYQIALCFYRIQLTKTQRLHGVLQQELHLVWEAQ